MIPCPTYRATLEFLPKVYRLARSAEWSRSVLPRVSRQLSTSSDPRNNANDLVSPRHQTLTLLHKVSNFLPMVHKRPGASEPTSLQHRISQLHQDLSTAYERPVKIVVCGLDPWSNSEDLVTALLAEPFSSNDSYTATLKERWNFSNKEQLHITYGPNSTTQPSTLHLSSTYLTQFSLPIEIIEVRTPSAGKPFSISNILEHSPISEADISIFVCNPLATPLSVVPIHILPSNSIVVFSAIDSQSDLDAILNQQQPQARPSHHAATKQIEIIAVDPRRAANAVHILQREPNSITAIQRYQDDILGSQISLVTEVLQSKLVIDDPKLGSSTIRTKLTLGRIVDALDSSHTSLMSMKSDLDHAFFETSRLQERIEECIAKMQGVVFGNRNGSGTKVADAVRQAQKELSQTMDRLSWWQMVWRVDDISTIVASAVSRVWVHGFEKQLVLETGQLTALQRDMSERTFALLSKHPITTTAILQNELLQLERSPSYHLSPESLTKPIHSRRKQIIEYPTNRLHIAGQRVALGTFGGMVTGVGVGWAGWMGWLVNNGEGVVGLMGTDANTAMAVGLLVIVASIRLGIGSWAKAKKRWWQDWVRVSEGLERDLKATLEDRMRQQVTVVAMTACKKNMELVKKREEEISVVGEELGTLQKSLDCIMADLSPTPRS